MPDVKKGRCRPKNLLGLSLTTTSSDTTSTTTTPTSATTEPTPLVLGEIMIVMAATLTIIGLIGVVWKLRRGSA